MEESLQVQNEVETAEEELRAAWQRVVIPTTTSRMLEIEFPARMSRAAIHAMRWLIAFEARRVTDRNLQEVMPDDSDLDILGEDPHRIGVLGLTRELLEDQIRVMRLRVRETMRREHGLPILFRLTETGMPESGARKISGLVQSLIVPEIPIYVEAVATESAYPSREYSPERILAACRDRIEDARAQAIFEHATHKDCRYVLPGRADEPRLAHVPMSLVRQLGECIQARGEFASLDIEANQAVQSFMASHADLANHAMQRANGVIVQRVESVMPFLQQPFACGFRSLQPHEYPRG